MGRATRKRSFLCSTAMKPREPSRSTCVKGPLLLDVVVGSSWVDSGSAVWRDGNDASIEIGAIKKTQLAEVRMRLLPHKPGSERA